MACVHKAALTVTIALWANPQGCRLCACVCVCVYVCPCASVAVCARVCADARVEGRGNGRPGLAAEVG